jgi:hypothetical protein
MYAKLNKTSNSQGAAESAPEHNFLEAQLLLRQDYPLRCLTWYEYAKIDKILEETLGRIA